MVDSIQRSSSTPVPDFVTAKGTRDPLPLASPAERAKVDDKANLAKNQTEQDKFERFGLTALPSREVDAPGIGECHARFECRLHETRITAEYPLFVWRVVRAHAAARPRWPATLHYRGEGRFMVAGRELSRRRLFRPDMLEQ